MSKSELWQAETGQNLGPIFRPILIRLPRGVGGGGRCIQGKNISILLDACQVPEENRVALTDEDCTKENVMAQLQAIGQQASDGDCFIFYYSGHGTNLKDYSGDEVDGQDEAFCFVTPDGQVCSGHVPGISSGLPGWGLGRGVGEHQHRKPQALGVRTHARRAAAAPFRGRRQDGPATSGGGAAAHPCWCGAHGCVVRTTGHSCPRPNQPLGTARPQKVRPHRVHSGASKSGLCEAESS